MKKIFYSAFITLLVIGCEKNNVSYTVSPSNTIDGKVKEMNFLIENSSLSKVTLGVQDNEVYPLIWEQSDVLGLYYDGDVVESENFKINDDGSSAHFTAAFPKRGRKSRMLYGFYPSVKSTDVDKENLSMSMSLPIQQEPRINAPDDSTVFLWSAYDVVDEDSEIKLTFKHVNAYACISVPKDLKIAHALIEADVPIAGDFRLSMETGKITIQNDASNIIELDVTRNEGELWFGCLPTESMKKLTVNLILDNGKILKKTIDTKGNQFQRAIIAKFTLDFSEKDKVLYYSFLQNDDPGKCDWQTGMFMSNSYYILQKYDEEYEENIFLFNKIGCGNDNSSMVIATFDKNGYPTTILSDDFYAELFMLNNGNYDILVHTEDGITTIPNCKVKERIMESVGPATKASQGISYNSYISAAGALVSVFSLASSFCSAPSSFNSIFGLYNDFCGGIYSLTSLSESSASMLCTCIGLPVSIIGVGLAMAGGSSVLVGVTVAGAVLSTGSLIEACWNRHKAGVYRQYLGACIPETLKYKSLSQGQYELGIKINGAETISSDFYGKNIGGILLKKYTGISTGYNIYSRSDNTNVILSFPIIGNETKTTTVYAEYGYLYSYQAFITPYCETKYFDTSDGNFIPKKRNSLFSTTYYGESYTFSPPAPSASTGKCISVTKNSAVVSCSFSNLSKGVLCNICCNGKLFPAANIEGEQEVTISGLEAGTNYSFYAVASVNGKQFKGSEKTFTTEAILPNIIGKWTITDEDNKVSGFIEVLESGNARKYDKNGNEEFNGQWSFSSWSVSASGNVSIRFNYSYNAYPYSQDVWEYYNGKVNDLIYPTKISGSKTRGACNSMGGYSESSCSVTLLR